MLGLGNSLMKSGAVEGAFSIDSLPSAIHWYKFDEGIHLNSGDPTRVERWDDQIGSKHLEQGSSARQPLYNNGELSFDSSLAKLVQSAEVNLRGFTICLVVEFTAAPNNETIVGHSTQSLQLIRLAAGATTKVRLQIDDGGAIAATITAGTAYPAAGTKFLFTITRDITAASNNIKTYVDDAFKSEGTHSANLKVFDIDEIGCHAGSSNPFQGNISEYVIFSDVLSDSDRALVQADIMTRNSIS